MLSEQQFRAVLDRFLATSREGTYDTYDEWRRAMHLLVAHASPEQWEEVLPRLRRGLRGLASVASRHSAPRERTRAAR